MEHREALLALRTFLSTQILGQEKLIERLLIALLADGHMLVEGAPGLAKTKAIKELAEGIEAQFHRIQFTPDLLPADITGTEIYRPETGSFVFQQGPIFHNLVLADEINRAPAKVQSALLEAMAERQVTVGRSTYELSPLFLVMATHQIHKDSLKQTLLSMMSYEYTKKGLVLLRKKDLENWFQNKAGYPEYFDETFTSERTGEALI